LIIYLDTSALAKRYIREAESDEVNNWISSAVVVGTALITHTEMASALAKARRMGFLDGGQIRKLWKEFLNDWTVLAHVDISEFMIVRASTLAWDYDLRGYDAVHLAAAVLWQEHTRENIYLGTFDRALWGAAKQVGLLVLPE